MIGHWDRDWRGCDRYRSPYGFHKLTEFLGEVLEEDDIAAKQRMLRSESSFYLWQSILRGAGVVTGCRRCQDVCPVGADYETLLADALVEIPEDTPGKRARLQDMVCAESAGELPDAYRSQQRWVGGLAAPKPSSGKGGNDA